MRFKLTDKRGPLVDPGKHLGLFGKANGNATHPSPPVNVNITITRDQVDANMDAMFNRVAARQAADRSPTRH